MLPVIRKKQIEYELRELNSFCHSLYQAHFKEYILYQTAMVDTGERMNVLRTQIQSAATQALVDELRNRYYHEERCYQVITSNMLVAQNNHETLTANPKARRAQLTIELQELMEYTNNSFST